MHTVLLFAVAVLAGASALRPLPNTDEVQRAVTDMVDKLYIDCLNCHEAQGLEELPEESSMDVRPIDIEKWRRAREGPVSYKSEDGKIQFSAVITSENVRIEMKKRKNSENLLKSVVMSTRPKVRVFGEVTASAQCTVKVTDMNPLELKVEVEDAQPDSPAVGGPRMLKVLLNSLIQDPEIQEQIMNSMRQQVPGFLRTSNTTEPCPEQFFNFLKENEFLGL